MSAPRSALPAKVGSLVVMPRHVRNRCSNEEAFVSHATHANAALTPRARLRLARLIVDGGWSGPSSRGTLGRVVEDGEEVGRPGRRSRDRPGWSTGRRVHIISTAAPRPR